jgi:hypothetical protein
MQNKIKDLKKIIAEEERKGGNFKRPVTAPIRATKVLARALFINSVLLFLCIGDGVLGHPAKRLVNAVLEALAGGGGGNNLA